MNLSFQNVIKMSLADPYEYYLEYKQIHSSYGLYFLCHSCIIYIFNDKNDSASSTSAQFLPEQRDEGDFQFYSKA